MKFKPVLIVLIMVMSLYGALYAADFIITEPLTEQPMNLALQKNPVKDSNDEPCALVIISTAITNVLINSALTPVNYVQKTGEVWVYLSAGDNYLKFEKTGYASLRYTFPLTLQKNMVYTLRLSSKAAFASADADLAQLTVSINEAEVFISKDNGAPLLNQENIAVFKLPKGEHTFRFTKAGFGDETKKISITKDDTIRVTLKPGVTTTKNKLPGYISITSEPSGAEVYINDQRLGVTPFTTDLTAGEHNLRLQKLMYESYQGTFTLSEKESKEIPLIKLKPMYGFYSVTTNPSGAKVYLDNKAVGIAPITKTRIESGTHSLRIETTDKLYHPHEEQLTVKNGDELNLKVDLLPAFGRLTVKSIPESGAKVYLDDKEVGTTPYDNAQQSSGRYLLKVEKELWNGFEDYIDVLDKQTTLREISLTKDFAEVNITAANCSIYQNDVFVSKDSYTQRLRPGNYKFKAVRDKYNDAGQEKYLSAGETFNLTLTPEPRQGSLAIETVPYAGKGAEIWLNGNKQKETTPAVLETLIGDYTIAVKHPKFLEQSKQITLKENDYQKVVFNLQTYSGSYMAKADRWGTVKWISLGTSVGVIGFGSFCYLQGDAYYDKYQKATSTGDAVNNREQYEKYDNLRNISFYVSPVPIVTYLFSYLKQIHYRKIAKSRM